jgi:hypothetical protein
LVSQQRRAIIAAFWRQEFEDRHCSSTSPPYSHESAADMSTSCSTQIAFYQKQRGSWMRNQ